MTNVERRTMVWTRHEFRVPAKGNNRDLYDALAMAMNHLESIMGEQATKYDDSLHYEVDEEYITVYWIERKQKEPSYGPSVGDKLPPTPGTMNQ